MNKYNSIKKIFEENNCILLTTYEEYIDIKNKFLEDTIKRGVKTSIDNIRVQYIASCNHNNDVAISNFKIRKTGVICRECKNIRVAEKMKSLHNNISNINQITEYNSITILNKYLSDKLIFKRTFEGSVADIIIKEPDIKDDLWIPIQIKATKTKGRNNCYTFRMIKDTYKDMLIICICIDEEKIWIIPYNDIQTKTNITISTKSVYNKYLINNEDIKNIILNYKDKYIRNTEAYFNLSMTYLQERERIYIRKRMKYINFLQYEFPVLQNTQTDFIINNKKIQEKVTGYRKDRDIQTIWFSSNNGKKDNGCKKFRTYRLGENDYYWLHSSINDIFWIIPENILYNQNFISGKNETKNRTYLTIKIINGEYKNNKWLKDYEYNYLQPCRDKISKLFE
jgi:hypothetical protein